VLVGGRTHSISNREALLNFQGPIADASERDALLHQLRLCIWYFCLGEQRSEDYRLYHSRPGGCVGAGRL